MRDQEFRAHTEDTVRRHIGTALDQRGLLCGAAELEESDAHDNEHATDLLKRAVPLWYPELDGRVGVAVDFGDAHTSARAGGALAFGAVAATLMAPAHAAVSGPATMACGHFNLGVGLVDGLCDSDPPAGTLLLDIVESGDLQGATERPQARGWLLAALPRRLATHPSLSFTLRVIEAFLELVHLVFPDERTGPVRSQIGVLLAEALVAERQSLNWASLPSVPAALESSRRTSVWPFRVIELVATGDPDRPEPSPGVLLGEAMWRIDDLVDLTDDAETGSLNALLVSEPAGGAGRVPLDAALRSVVRSGAVEAAAQRAADDLAAGLRASQAARRPLTRNAFLAFVQRYAGLPSTSEE